jgi:hypothetical protein
MQSEARCLIDNDQAVSRNYRWLVSKGFEGVYERAEPSPTIGEFRERLYSGNIYVRKYYMRAYS